MASDEVHVWRASLSLPAARVDALQQTLSADELDRAEKFHFLKDRQRFVVTRGVLRSILGRYLELEPERLRFCYSSYGKPALESGAGRASDLGFNVAHSGELGLFALTPNRRIGVDLERLRADLNYQQIAEQFFSPQERSALRAMPADLRPEAFFNCWTRKEAYLKAGGEGLSTPLAQFAVSLAPGEPARLLSNATDSREVTRWSLQELWPGPGYVGALAVEGAGWHVRYWQWLA